MSQVNLAVDLVFASHLECGSTLGWNGHFEIDEWFASHRLLSQLLISFNGLLLCRCMCRLCRKLIHYLELREIQVC